MNLNPSPFDRLEEEDAANATCDTPGCKRVYPAAEMQVTRRGGNVTFTCPFCLSRTNYRKMCQGQSKATQSHSIRLTLMVAYTAGLISATDYLDQQAQLDRLVGIL